MLQAMYLDKQKNNQQLVISKKKKNETSIKSDVGCNDNILQRCI